MKTNKITRRSFLLGLGAAAAASALTACGGFRFRFCRWFRCGQRHRLPHPR